MALKKCVVCGKLFEVEKGNAKYCSQACRDIGTAQKRKQWETRTDYAAKQRERTALYREKLNAERLQAAEQKRIEDAVNQQQAEETAAAEREAQFQKRIAAGDPLAVMIQAQQKGDLRQYLKAFQQYELSAYRGGNTAEKAVNGVCVTDPDFVESAYDAVMANDILYIYTVTK